MPVRVGASGWSYEDWVGPVYPRHLPPGEWLGFYASRFPTVEVNVTFYRTPPLPTVLGWIEKTRERPRFELTVKAPRELTEVKLHAGSLSEIDDFARGWAADVLAPLAVAGRLGAVLLQLAPRVRCSADSLARLDAALTALHAYDVAVELRHPSWLRAPHAREVAPRAMAVLDAHGAALVALDGPSFPVVLSGEARHAYVRLHGRNADIWFAREDAARDEEEDARLNRYDYEYAEDEIDAWAERLAALEREKDLVRVYFNNHPAGHAFRNAGRLEELLEARSVPVERAASGPQKRLDAY